jgi:cytochrome c biogenesis protein CcdA
MAGMMDLLLAYGAGLLTLINPCVLPVLPIVLAGALQSHRLGPVALAAGMSASFVVVGLVVTAFGRALGLTEDIVTDAGALLMIGFGLVLLVPRFSGAFATATAGVSARADAGIDAIETTSLRGQFAGGALLGAVWSPCIGPTLGGAIALASQQQALPAVTATLAAFAAGVSTIILALGYGARAAILRRQAAMRRLAASARPILGGVFLATGLAILFRLNHAVNGWLLSVMPAWLVDLSVSL